MLQQILRDMWVDPDLLAELDEDQKQTLFCRMREEQVRRWKEWDKKLEDLENDKLKKDKKPKVKFLLGPDGDPWTWVMGEHQDDKTVEQILEEEVREKARLLAEKETQELRKSVEAELSEILDMNQKQIKELEAAQIQNQNRNPILPPKVPIEDDIYCSVDQLKRKSSQMSFKMNNLANEKIDVLQEISLNNSKNKVTDKVAQWEKKVMEQKTSEIFNRLQKKQLESVKEAEEAERKQEQLWIEQERKAKEAEFQIRQIARRAREEHRRASHFEMENKTEVEKQILQPTISPPSTPTSPVSLTEFCLQTPPRKKAVVDWFLSTEVNRRAGIDSQNHLSPWFHGLITRKEAESILANKPVGSFLVRISERIWGYAISYRDYDRCKHYLIDASSGHYQFLGPNQIIHETLGDLIEYHKTQVITVVGGELLTHACHPVHIPDVFRGLPVVGAR